MPEMQHEVIDSTKTKPSSKSHEEDSEIVKMETIEKALSKTA